MSDAPKVSAECLTPILFVHDFSESMNYYTQKLLFNRLWDWGDPPSFGAVRLDKVEIFFCLKGQGQPGTWMMIFLDSVDDLYREFQERGAKVLKSPTNMPWGTREMNVEDPDGHRIRFGSDSTGPVDSAEVGRYWDELQFPDR